MRALGLTSIYHDMGSASPRRESTKRFILRCETCKMEVLRRKRPPALVSCGRCSRRTYDPRFQIRVLEIVEMRDVAEFPQAANRAKTSS